MTEPLIKVNAARISVLRLPHLQLNDVLQNAPEPPMPGWTSLRTNSANVLYLHELFPNAVWDDPDQRLLEARSIRYLRALRREQPGEYEYDFPYRMQPYEFQRELFTHARHMKGIACAPVALGTGKTKMALDIAADKFLRDEIDCLLVIAPNGVHRQWINTALEQHMSPSVPYKAAVWKSTVKNMPQDVVEPGRIRKLRILSFNIEAFSASSGRAIKAASAFARSGRCMTVVDESSRIKSPRAARTRTIMRLRDLSVVRVILTGTPMTKNLMDLFSQYEFIDPAIIGMSNAYTFRARYCVTMPAFRGAAFGQVKIVGYKNQEELIRKLAPVTFMVPKDVLGLPEQRWAQRTVPMTREQVEVYNALKNELIEDLRAKRIATPANAAVRLLRLQQVLCGRYVEQSDSEDEDEPYKVIREIPSLRHQVLRDVLEEHDGQAVIWARFQPDIDLIVKTLSETGARVAAYDGRTKDADRAAAIEAFKSGDLDYIVANQAAGGTGVDGMQVASLAVYYSNSFNAEHRWQSEGRIHRIGTQSPVLYLDLECPNTVDKLIRDNLKNKSNVARAIFDNPLLLSSAVEDDDAEDR